MLPEKWDSIYLYASVIQHAKLQTGEMFFYYIPKGVLKKNPVNVYEVPSRFNIEEQDYLKLVDDLYEKVKELREEMINSGEKPWSNVTISIEKIKFKAEFMYDNLSHSKFSSYDRHLAWQYEYLNKPLNSYNKKEREIIEQILSEKNIIIDDISIYEEPLYIQKDVKSIIDFDKEEINDDINQFNKDMETSLHIENKKENILNEISTNEVKKVKSQILNC